MFRDAPGTSCWRKVSVERPIIANLRYLLAIQEIEEVHKDEKWQEMQVNLA